jgi:hypothetical protein
MQLHDCRHQRNFAPQNGSFRKFEEAAQDQYPRNGLDSFCALLQNMLVEYVRCIVVVVARIACADIYSEECDTLDIKN